MKSLPACWFLPILALAMASCQSHQAEPLAATVAATADKLASLHGDNPPAPVREEANRLALVAEREARALAISYGVSGPAWFHNCLVNTGLKERGLCWQYMEDMFTRLTREKPRHFDLHCVVRDDNSTFLEHNCVLLAAKGQPFVSGWVLDPWVKPGTLRLIRPCGEGRSWHEQPGYTQHLEQKFEKN
ncbi:MAG: hypothetical protein ACKO2G_15100 [Verrucomicrobiales bacterium]